MVPRVRSRARAWLTPVMGLPSPGGVTSTLMCMGRDHGLLGAGRALLMTMEAKPLGRTVPAFGTAQREGCPWWCARLGPSNALATRMQNLAVARTPPLKRAPLPPVRALTAPRNAQMGHAAPATSTQTAAFKPAVEARRIPTASAPCLTHPGTESPCTSASTITTSFAIIIATTTTTGCVALDWTRGRLRTAGRLDLRPCRAPPPIVIVTSSMDSGSVWLGSDVTDLTTGGGGRA